MGEERRWTLDGLAERVDSERLRQRPGWRLFRAHPAVGLEECEEKEDVAFDLRPHELGVRWLALGAEEQRARERAFVRTLLEHAAAQPDSAFAAGWWRDAERTQTLARRCGGSLAADATACGPLTATAIDVLIGEIPQLCYVVGGDDLVVDLSGLPLGMTVWMDRWKAPALEAELLDRVHDDAEARMAARVELPESRRRDESDRTLRAQVLVTWSRHSSKPVSLAVGLLAMLHWHPLGAGRAADLAAAVVVAIVVTATLERLLEAWYRRGS